MVAAGLVVLVVAGLAGQFLTDGYADVLWSAAAVGAVGFGLVLAGSGQDLGACVLLLAVAGLTKNEGTACAVAIVVLLTAAPSGALGPNGRGVVVPWWRPLLFGALGVVALCAWPVLTRLLGAAPDVAVAGKRVGNDLSRLHLTVDAMTPHLHVLLAAVPLALLGAVVLRRAPYRRAPRQRRLGLGGPRLRVGGRGRGLRRRVGHTRLLARRVGAPDDVLPRPHGLVDPRGVGRRRHRPRRGARRPLRVGRPLLPVLHHPV